jgi:hypothetical protein
MRDDDMYDFECNRCLCGYDYGDGRYSKSLGDWVCEQCYDELKDEGSER